MKDKIRIKGMSGFGFGISWDYSESEQAIAKKVISFLEFKRVLVNPAEMEIPEHCATSVIEIKNFLVGELPKVKDKKALQVCLREMCSACNKFLDELPTENRHKIIYKNTNGNWEDASYSRILKEFRDTFIECIKTITTEYKIEIPNKLI